MTNQHIEDLGPFFSGSRIGVMLVHGLTGTPKEMLSVAKRLHKYGFTTFCPVLAGHCGSDEELLATCWQDWVDSAEKALLRFREHVDVIFVCGISAGAVISLYLADRYPDVVRALGLYSITLKWDGWSIPKSMVLASFALLIPYIAKKFYFSEAFPYGIKNENLRKRIVAKLNSGDTSAAGHTCTPGITLRELLKMVKKVKKRFPYIHTSSLIVHANHDDIAGLKENALYLQKHLAGSTELLILHDSYHLVTVDQERHKVSDETARFFAGYLDSSEYELLIAVAKNNISNIKRENNLQMQNDNRDALVAV